MITKPVSLWIGTAESEEALDDYMRFTYTEDGDALLSPFCRDFHLGWFDEDFLEAALKPPSAFVTELLARHSYASEIAPLFIRKYGDHLPFTGNAVVLLYEFLYNGEVASADGGAVRLRYIGDVDAELV